MPDTTFTPINAAVRRISAGEGEALRGFLGSDLSLEEFIATQGIDPATAQQALTETGLTLPERGLGNRFAETDLKLYTDILQGGQDFFSASETFGFDPEAGVEALQESGLRVPLQSSNRTLFDTASNLGLSSTRVSETLGLEQGGVDLTLAAAGLSLPGKKSSGAATGADGVTGDTNILEGAFSGIPQAPGVKLGFLQTGRKGNPNIKSGPRGVTESAPVRQRKLTAGSV